MDTNEGENWFRSYRSYPDRSRTRSEKRRPHSVPICVWESQVIQGLVSPYGSCLAEDVPPVPTRRGWLALARCFVGDSQSPRVLSGGGLTRTPLGGDGGLPDSKSHLVCLRSS